MSEHELIPPLTSEEKEELARLKRSRGSIKGRLTKYSEYVNLIQVVKKSELTSVRCRELELKLNKIQSLIPEFEELQDKIESLDPDTDAQIQERDTIESSFMGILARGQEILETSATYKNKGECQNDNVSLCGSHVNNSIKLPIIRLPTFDGNYLQWLEFRDTFESMINSNGYMPSINKFHYLRSALIGTAAVVIKCIEFSEQNYSVAWDLLCERYNNKNILINNHLKSLYSLETISKESYKALRFIIDHVSKHLRALESLGQPTDKWDTLIIFMVSGKLDLQTSTKWEEYKANLSELPSLSEFYAFLRSRADVLETSFNNRSDKEQRSVSHQIKSKTNYQCNSFVTSFVKKSGKDCDLCNQVHYLHQCPRFIEMSMDDRLNIVENRKLCKNCFRVGHNSFKCQLRGCCRLCKKKHNTLLHVDTSTCATETAQPSTSSSLPVSLSAVSTGQVLLCTAIVSIFSNNNYHTVRALLDTGSQSSFITEECKRRLGLTTNVCSPINICGINQVGSNVNEYCLVKVKAQFSDFNIRVKCLVIPKITGLLPSSEIYVNKINFPEKIKFADPTFFRPSNIDILLGADVYWDIIENDTIKLGSHQPVLQNSKLGWLVAGPITNSQSMPQQINCNFSQEIREELRKFWHIDNLPSDSKSFSAEERLCESHFLETHTRLPNGRFSVQMPIKENPERALIDNFYVAKKCLFSLEKRLEKYPKLKNSYRQFLKEYEHLGHLTPIKKPKFGYYMPHHAIIREKSETTKLRTVFNASVKTASGKSLNDIQMIGPVVQSDLISILLRFRQHRFIFIGDIEKMYRQIEIDPNQRHLQLILWRENSEQPIQVLQLNTVTYGTASAPFISTRCLLQLARECEDTTIAHVIENDFYVDDLTTGCDTVDGIKHIVTGVIQVLNSACLPLRKFRTNCPNLFDTDNHSLDSLDLYTDASVLGLNYSPKTDTLQFSTDLTIETNITKRSVLSITSKIFDPLGLLSPCVIVAKILLQNLWSSKLDWDDPVPERFSKNWAKLLREFSTLFEIKIPRRVLSNIPVNIELHCFVDASQQAYAACVYLRSQDSDSNELFVKLLCAKTRVAPLKGLTIPRLELCGTLLGAQLSNKVLKALNCNITRKVIWTDSTVVLGWLHTPPRDLKTFVCNRVNEIIDLTPDFEYFHLPTECNPADLASRGVNPKYLQSSLLWWEGPAFLRSDPREWPKQSHKLHTVNLPDIKKMVNCHVESQNNVFIHFENYSNINLLKRTYAWVLRFINNCRSKEKNLGELDTIELDNSLLLLVKISQSQSFPSELSAISTKRPIHRKSKLTSLTPFLDSKGVLRVGGRLENSEFSYDKKHPMIIDAKHNLTKLLMKSEHLRLFHAGPQLLLASIRERFWPINGRNLARTTTKQCMVCTRFKGKTLQPLMGNLPAERSVPTFAFYSCGVDMAGPFLISSRKGRGNRVSKCYLCLFVCLTTKAIHLELVSDLSTEAFILAFRRFISRRGRPSTIFCDNGTNFRGASNELSKLYRSSRQSLNDFGNDEGIKFMFSPAYSPHFGGIWEAGVKSAKYHLRRIAGNASLTFEELATLFTQIEAILNSRPLTPLSSEPTDLSPLTPGHFLIGRPLTSVPSPSITCKRPNRYQLIEQLRQHFWDRWRQEYVAELQLRIKWKARQQELKVGDLVILKQENLPPLQWSLARVTQLHPGPDGVTRVADILTHKGVIRRAVNKMCPLHNIIESDDAFNAAEDVNA